MSRRLLLSAIATIACLLAPAAVAAGASSSTLPTIKQVKPLQAKIGDKLTIVGTHFLPGKQRNTVVFLRDGAPAVFLRAEKATKTQLTITLTSKLGKFLVKSNTGAAGATRFRLRVLAKRFGASFTPLKQSPTISPGGSGGSSAPACTQDTAKAAPNADADKDGLANSLELKLKTDPCNSDTDGDAIPDGYEYESALDLNLRALPYPGKRPYPNALDPSDAGTDYDGDGLTLSDEHAAWVAYGHSNLPLNYSDGTQTSGGPDPVTAETAWQDINGDGFLTDDEKDVDGDGLTNWDEAHGRMTPAWWVAAFEDEPPYTLSYLQTDWLDPDTDGDGLPDGADDVDHDGWSNHDEVVRGPYWVQPFNPCLPDWKSRACSLHPPFVNPYPPFRPDDPRSPLPLPWPH